MNKREDLIKMFSEGLSIEELRTISNLEELKQDIENSDITQSLKKELLKGLSHLIKDTLFHARIFTELIKGSR